MKGRTYDPRLGRFLQADPFVQGPGYSQSWNPYAYVLNNPFAFVDPSGYLRDAKGRECIFVEYGGTLCVSQGSGDSYNFSVVGTGETAVFTADEVEVTAPSAEGSRSPPSLLDVTWAFGRAGGSSEAGRERSDGRMRAVGPNDVGYRLAVGVTANVQRKLQELPDDFATAVDVLATASAVGGAVKGKYSPGHELTWRLPSPSLFLRPRGAESRISRWILSRSLSARPSPASPKAAVALATPRRFANASSPTFAIAGRGGRACASSPTSSAWRCRRSFAGAGPAPPSAPWSSHRRRRPLRAISSCTAPAACASRA
jgi:hypothetical protein